MDTRVLWLQKVVQLQLGITAESTEGKNFTETSSVSLTQFLDSINKNFIIVILDERDMKTRIIDQIDAFNPTSRYVIIAKNTNITASTQITLDNIRNSLNIIPLIKSPVNSLYQTLHSVFSPVLLKNTKWGLDNKLLDLISELDSGLGSVIRSTNLSDNSSSVTPLANSSIRTFEDEYMYWKDQETALKTSKAYMERARLIRETLEPLKNEFEQLKVKDLSEILEVIDMIQDTYDELWKLAIEPPYPQDRMINLLSIAGDQIISAIGTKMSAYKYIMQEPLMKVKDSIITGDQICEKYLFAVSNLTMRYWSHYNQHVWKPVTLDLEVLKMFSSRLNEILNLKTIFEMLADLLSTEEKKSFKVDTVTHIFKDINPFSCNKYNDQVWKELCIQFNRLLSPIEEKVAAKLRSLFNDLQNQPGQLMREFKRYAELIQRDSISKYLASEKEVFLNQLISYLKNNQAELKEKVQTTMQSKGRNLPHAVNSIVWASQCLSKVEEAAKLILTLTGSANQYYKTSMELEAEMFKYKKELFAEWVSETELELDRPDGILMLKKTGRLMDLDYQNGKLIINYDDRLVTLLREVRMLVSLGFAVPGRIQSAAEIGSQFYRHAVILKQVAHFYNTIDQQMLPSQQSMLLDSALKFEQLVKNPKNIKHDGKTKSPKDSAVSWSSPSELEQYIERLQAAADKLTNDNRKLRKYHEIIIDQVQNLSNVDLVRNQQKYKDILNIIRNIIQSVEDSGIKQEDTLSWRNHWDYQIYKTLEHQYRLGLESMSERLPEISVELIFKQQRVQFRPTFEDIRLRYYREMKKFINIPNSFRAFGDGKVFLQMVECNEKSLSVVYQKTEVLFTNLAKVTDMFKDWVVLGTVNLEEFVEEALFDVADWELNFRMLKSKGKEAEQIPSTIQVECITISTAPIKAAIDDHLQALMDIMLSALRKAINKHMSAIEEFAAKGIEVLSNRPQTLAEIGEANLKHEDVSKSKLLVKTHFEEAEKKNKLLKSVSGGGIDNSGMKNKWNKLELMMEGHELMIKEQMEVFRNAINVRVQANFGEIEKYALRWNQLKPNISDITNTEMAIKAVAFIKERSVEFEELEKTSQQILLDCSHFGLPNPDYSMLKGLKSELLQSEKMWSSFGSWIESINLFMKEDWITFRTRLSVFEDSLCEWTEKIKSMPMNPIIAHILNDIDSYQQILPSLKFVRGDSWGSEHWGELFQIIGIPKGVTIADLTLGHFLSVSANILKEMERIKELNSRALGEISIRDGLQEVDMWGASALLTLIDYEDALGKKLNIIKDWKDTLSQLGDIQSLLQSLKESPYFKNYSDKVLAWESKLGELDEVLRNLNTVQRKWVYLEPIFSKGSLPSEQSRFERIDDDFRSIMKNIARDKRAVSILSYSGIRQSLAALVDQLERCQKALNEFLEEKRSKFARFYFIGDEDLLEILGQSKNPTVIQSHLKKLFAAVHSVRFDHSMKEIVAMVSQEGETVYLSNPVRITGEVESWLESFAQEMKVTLKKMLKQCLSVTDLHKYPAQIIGLTELLHFTSKCELAISKGTLVELSTELTNQLSVYTQFNYHAIQSEQEKKVISLKVKALVMDVIHHIDVVDQLKAANVTLIGDWTWQKQLRFYITKDDVCVARMHDAEFKYTFEYQGNPGQLVHTPLTDKCYLTLTQAMANGFGGNPFGPAGTGKTESVKALGVLMGRQVLVFNCDEGIDYKSMGRIFVGIVKCGAWGCFDEFNRLEEAVLSAVSQQIQVIQAGLKIKTKSIKLMNTSVDLDPNSGIFVTLNPAGKGYGGRQKLPDNLKQLFRSVAMTNPNIELIAEVILYSEGFKQGKSLGKKVCAAFTLCKQLLSGQQHYDWGLRPLKATLWLAGQLLAEENKTGSVDGNRESTIILKALRVNTLSKLTFADSKRFLGLMEDIFCGIVAEDIKSDRFSHALKKSYKDLGLCYNESQAEKGFQFYQACRQRMGIVIVGPSGSGKSTIWKLVKMSMIACGEKVKHIVLNPKAIDRTTLLGQMDLDTREWSDGVITYASRQAVKEAPDVKTWIICDGDIDPEWVESLNSVLDDNRLLTMPNGERIQFGPNVNFIFETNNLKFASPATVSRMGMIFLSDETIDVPAIINAWLAKIPEKQRDHMKTLMDSYFFQSLKWILRNSELMIKCSKVGIVLNGISHLTNVKSKTEFLFALLKGFGSNLSDDSKKQYAKELWSWASESHPDEKNILEYHVSEQGKYVMYKLIEPSNPLSCTNQNLPIIETVDVQRNMNILFRWFRNGEPFILIGSEGVGKHMILRHCFSKFKNVSISTIHCSSQTRSSHVIQRLLQCCLGMTTNTGRVLRPKDSEKLVLYLKDIDLPTPDKYETVELIQFLQQLLTYKGFYDRSLEWVAIENVQVVCTMNPAGSLGRHHPSTRFTSIVRLFHVSYTDQAQQMTIYKNILQSVLESCFKNHPMWSLSKNIQKIAASMVRLYSEVKEYYSVDMYPHYIFTLRDLSNWVVNLRRYEYHNNDEHGILDVLAYESLRIFHDKLVTKDHRQKFIDILSNVMSTDWDYKINLKAHIFTTMLFVPQKREGTRVLSKLDLPKYTEIISKELYIYERDHKVLNLWKVPETMQRLARMERALGQAGGSILLAGRSGVGRSNCVDLAIHMLKMTKVTLCMGRDYSLKAFSAELKVFIQRACVQAEEIVLVVEDYQLVIPGILESLNSLISGGEIPGLYTQDELDSLLQSIKPFHSESGERCTLHDYFIHRIQKFMHIVLIFDTKNPNFIRNCESNPALYTLCQLDWKNACDNESFQEFAKASFSNSPILKEIPNWGVLIKILLDIHENMSSTIGATTKHFSELLATYQFVLKSKKEEMLTKQRYLQGGLTKLAEASKFVDTLSSDAKKQGVELSEKQEEADQALKKITESMVNAVEQKKEMETLKVQLGHEESKLLVRKEAIERELSDVEPIVKQAKSAVGDIKSESLSEIRSLRAPPPAIRDVLEGVLRLMGNLDMSWNSMKGFLGKRNVKDEILNFDARNISKQIRDSVNKLLKEKAESFEEANIKRSSLAAAPLAMWVKANLKYSAVLEKIEPLEEDLRKLSKSLNSSRARVEKLHSELSIVDNAVAELRDGFTGKTREADALKLSLQKANTTIKIAQNLLEKLSGEGNRWTAQSKEISECLKNAPLNTLLSSAFITYLAGQPEHIRSEVCSYWKKTTGAIDFNFLSLMSTESEQLLWKKDGVASDVLSLQNIVVILNSHNIPTLFVDPNGQAISWLKCYLARNSENKYDVIKSHDASFMRSVELAIRFGKTLIVEDVLEIEPLLYPILKKEHIKQGPRKSVQLGEKLIDYNDNFKIYFVSKSSDFALPSAASGLINLVNFTITRSGLAAQLLAITLENENPELEREKLQIIKEEDSLKLSLGKLEESLLKELANSEGNILDNKNLIDSLNETKQKSINIANGLAQSKKTQELLNVEWNKFSPLSNYAAGLYFVLRDLVKLNNMYKFSLPWFLRIFEETLQVKGERNTQETESRIKTLLHNLEKTTYSYVCRSIFKEDHHMFALYLIHMLHKSLFQDKEWDLFLGSILLVDDVEKENNSGIIPPWVPTECLAKIKQIQKVLPKLYDLALFTDSNFWSNWMKRPDCEQNFPSASNISPFQKVIIIQALRPDRLLTAITDFCTKILGIDSLSPPSLSIKAMYENTRPNEPILFITTPGTDPSPELRELANKDIGINNYIEISMGQGQGEYAIESLLESRKTGKWVNLQNIHLVTGWLTELEKFLSDSKNCEIHPKFRLWLTSEAHPKFPMGLLESCLKITIEAPPGVKNNLSRIYENWSPEFISTGSVLRGQILFSLALFHATVQERRNFLPQGWIKFYEFSNADLRSSAELITNMCKGSKTPQWPILHGILELAVYGGRMDDVFDILKLKTYLRQFFNDEVFIINGRQASKKLIKGLLLPNTTSYQAYLGLIKDFPVGNEANSTNIGLPSNVDQTFQQVSSDTIINQLKHLKQSDISSSNFDRHQWTKELAPFLIVWKKLNSGNDMINKKPKNTAINSPLISFLSLELASALEILRKIHTDLTALSKILKGSVLLSSELSIVATELMRLNVPGSWADLWEGPENPREYMNAVMENTICVDKWNELAIKNDLLESNQIIDLRKFFNPLTFLNALRQLTCRSVNEAIDSLKLISTWSLSDLAATPIKIQVSGLFLQGARFDGKRLSEASAHDKPFETVPNFYLAYVKNDSALYKNRLEVPLYVGRNREKFITCLNVPITAGEESRWIQYGISFFLAI